MTAVLAQSDLMHEVEQFLFLEARLADEHRYEEWEALWTDDGIYWVPANGDDIDPEMQMSIIYDNRSRIGLRVRQLLSGKRYTQEPRSSLRRIVGNVELQARSGDEFNVAANAITFESSQRGEVIWASRNEYRLRRNGSSFKIARKKVSLVNNDRAIYTLSFLI